MKACSRGGFRSALGAVVLVTVFAWPAAAQSDRALAPGLDSLAGAGVPENRPAGIGPAVILGSDIPVPADARLELGLVTRPFAAAGDGVTGVDARVEVLPASRAELITPSAFDAGTPLRRRPSLRDAGKMGLIGAAAGAVIGMGMELFVDPDGEIVDVWPTVLAIPGFFVGVIYSLVR